MILKKEKTIHYISLFVVLIIGAMALIGFSYDRAFQVLVAVVVSIGYVLWGIMHHRVHKDLYLPVVIEYLAVSILGLVIVLSLIFQA